MVTEEIPKMNRSIDRDSLETSTKLILGSSGLCLSFLHWQPWDSVKFKNHVLGLQQAQGFVLGMSLQKSQWSLLGQGSSETKHNQAFENEGGSLSDPKDFTGEWDVLYHFLSKIFSCSPQGRNWQHVTLEKKGEDVTKVSTRLKMGSLRLL